MQHPTVALAGQNLSVHVLGFCPCRAQIPFVSPHHPGLRPGLGDAAPTGRLPHVGADPRVCPCIGGFPAVCAWRADTGVCPYAWLPLPAAFRPRRSKNCIIKCTKKAHPASCKVRQISSSASHRFDISPEI